MSLRERGVSFMEEDTGLDLLARNMTAAGGAQGLLMGQRPGTSGGRQGAAGTGEATGARV